MEEELPETEFDAIILGTGMVETILAGAIARSGKSVLHLDHRRYYGGCHATVDLSQLAEMACEDDARSSLSNWTVVTDDDKEAVDALMTKSSRFQLDLASGVLFSRGPMVDALVQSGTSKYSEFVKVDSTMVHVKGQLRQVPCSKNEVFADKSLSLLDKRTLMRFLQLCYQHMDAPAEVYKDHPECSFVEFLDTHKISPELKDVICYAIACANCNQTESPMSVQQGVASVTNYLKSVGRFGSTAFLSTKYGVSELPQGFTRLAAIFGGMYVLGRGIQHVTEENGRCTGVVCSVGQQLNAPVVISEPGYLRQFHREACTASISRAICIHSRPWIGEGEVATVTVPPTESHPHPVFMIQTSEASSSCPEGYYVLNVVSTAVHGTPEQDLSQLIDQLGAGPALWAVFYSQRIFECEELPAGVYACGGPNSTVFVEDAVPSAKAIFEKIYPDAEFLEPMPEPEDDELDSVDCNGPA